MCGGSKWPGVWRSQLAEVMTGKSILKKVWSEPKRGVTGQFPVWGRLSTGHRLRG